MEEEDVQETEKSVENVHYIAHVDVPSQKEVNKLC